MAVKEVISAGAGGVVYAAGVTRHTSVIGALHAESATDQHKVMARDSYTLGKLFARVIANATTAGSTVKSVVNGVVGAQTVSIGAGLTGVFEDTTNTDAIVTGDWWLAEVVTGTGGTMTISIIRFSLGHSGTITVQGSTQRNIFSGNGLFFMAIGGLAAQSSTESNWQYPVRNTPTFSNLTVHLRSNARDVAITFGLRINGVNGNQSVSVGAGLTGLFEDAVNTDSPSAGDLVNYYDGMGTGTGAIGAWAYSMERSKAPNLICGGALPAISVDAYLPVNGSIASGTVTEADVKLTARTSFTAKNLAVRSTAHGASDGINIYFRKNGVNSALTVNIPSATTGLFEDVTNSISIVSGDEYNYFIDHGGGAGSVTLSFVGFEQADLAGAFDLDRVERYYGRGYGRGYARSMG